MFTDLAIATGDVAANPGPDGHSKSVLNCYLQNVRSLKAVNNDGISNENKMSDLQDIVYSRDLDIICLTETWLNDSINNREIFPLGYNIYRKDRLTRVGGGVLIAVKSCYCSSELHMTSDLEIVLVEIELTRNRNLLLINCYNPPNSTDFIPKLTSLFTSIQFLSYSGVYLVGDFNFPEITWINGSGFTNSTTGDNELFVNLTLDYNLFQFVNQPTRNSNILDLVFTNSFEYLSNVETGPQNTGLCSDHLPVNFEIAVSLKFKNSSQRYRFDYSKADYNTMNKLFTLLPLSSGVATVNSPEEFDSHWPWEFWNDIVFSTVKDCIPKVKCRSPNFPPWIRKDLANAIRKKRTIWKKVRNSNDMNLKERFRKERQRIKNWIRSERKRYLADIANEAYLNPKRFWSFYSFKHRKNSIPHKIFYNGASTTDDNVKAETFLHFFQSIYTDHELCFLESVEGGEINPTTIYLSNIRVSTNEVEDMLHSLDCTKAIGPDNLPSAILKNCASSLAPSMTAFFNCSFANGYFLSVWKYANLCPFTRKRKKLMLLITDRFHFYPFYPRYNKNVS